MKLAEELFNKLLASAGLEQNGSRPWDPQIRDKRMYRRVLTQGSLGLGESYMDGWWDCPALDEFFTRVLRSRTDHKVVGGSMLQILAASRLMNMQSRLRSQVVAKTHYDIGNDLYSEMLGSSMMYSCGYWRHAGNLNEAQEAKLELIAGKLELRKSQRVLDIGCGWGTACKYFAERHGVQVVGLTLSTEQAAMARQLCNGYPVEILQKDYRDFDPQRKFDAVYSIGMFEHVGYKNYRAFMRKVSSLLAPEGRFLLHTIGGNASVTHTDPWINRYIFPHGMLPSIQQIGKAIERLFVMEDWHNFGLDYDRTLMEWLLRFEAAWEMLSQNYDERFFRMWRYYLCMCAGSFRARRNQLWQVLLVPNGLQERAPACR